MSIEQLRTDMTESAGQLAELAASPTATSASIAAFLRDTLWPTLVATVDEMEEIDGCVADLLHGQEDILQPETAALFGAIVVTGRTIAAELKKRLRADESDLRKVVDGFEELAKSAESAIEEITIPEDEGEDDEGEEE